MAFPFPLETQTPNAITLDISDQTLVLDGKTYYADNIDWGYIGKLLFNEERKCFISQGFNQCAEHQILYTPPQIRAPEILPKWYELVNAKPMKPSEVFNTVRKWIDLTIEHPLPVVKDIIALYAVYTWYARFYPKRSFLIVTGMYGTGKSVVGQILRAFGRYVVETNVTNKSAEWELALTMGTYLIDEAESLKKAELARLRKLHDEGYRITKMLGVKGGHALIQLHLSVPVVLIGTHVPEDPALISRSVVLKMHYGEPPEKPPSVNSALAREYRASMVMTVVETLKDYREALRWAKEHRPKVKLNKREEDVWLPLCATARLVGLDICEDLAVFVKVSTYISNTLTPGRRLVYELAREILRKGERVGRLVMLPEPAFNNLVAELEAKYMLPEKDLRYIIRYFHSAAYFTRRKNTYYLAWLASDLENITGMEVDLLDILEKYGGPEIFLPQESKGEGATGVELK